MDAKKRQPPALDPDRRLYPVSEAADYLSLSRSKVYSLMEQGTLAYIKIGRSRRIPMAAILALIESHRVGR